MCVRVRIAQAAVMWNVVYNPIERVIAPVIRGNPWGWDPATTGDDWPCVPFHWDTGLQPCVVGTRGCNSVWFGHGAATLYGWDTGLQPCAV